MSQVPLNDLSRSVVEHRTELDEAVRTVLDSGWFVHGPQHDAFERELAAVTGSAHAIGVGNGTDALELALRAVMPAGRSVVLTAANAGGYTTTAARRGGFSVRYADVDEQTHCLSADSVAPLLSAEIGVVVVTHLYGRLAPDVQEIVARCHDRGIAVLEDCAQSIGARNDDGPAGSFGDVSSFSFYPTKNLGALGDGGAVCTSDEALADRIRALSQYGWDGKYRITLTGGANSRLDEIQAAILRVRLKHIDAWNAARRAIIGRYAAAASARVRVLPAADAGHVGHLAVVVADDREALRLHLNAAGIRHDVHYPVPDHRQDAFADDFREVTLPITESLAERILSVPCFPELTDDEIERVCDALAAF